VAGGRPQRVRARRPAGSGPVSKRPSDSTRNRPDGEPGGSIGGDVVGVTIWSRTRSAGTPDATTRPATDLPRSSSTRNGRAGLGASAANAPRPGRNPGARTSTAKPGERNGPTRAVPSLPVTTSGSGHGARTRAPGTGVSVPVSTTRTVCERGSGRARIGPSSAPAVAGTSSVFSSASRGPTSVTIKNGPGPARPRTAKRPSSSVAA
jgi:hypothetical protein